MISILVSILLFSFSLTAQDMKPLQGEDKAQALEQLLSVSLAQSSREQVFNRLVEQVRTSAEFQNADFTYKKAVESLGVTLSKLRKAHNVPDKCVVNPKGEWVEVKDNSFTPCVTTKEEPHSPTK